MSILKKEMKQGLKPFIIWVIGIAFLSVGSMVKFVGFEETDSGSITAMFSSFPKAVLAMFGMSDVNIETFGGFFSVVQFYVVIAVCCYAIQLGTNSVLRESVDKTYEFLFTKPCGRLHILSMKLSGSFIYLTLICALNCAFSYLAPAIYGIKNTISDEMLLFNVAMYLIALFFFALSVLLSVILSRAERATQVSYAVLLIFYAFSVVYDMDEKFEFFMYLTPFKFFKASELLTGVFDIGFAFVLLGTSVVFILISYNEFKKKDLNAV